MSLLFGIINRSNTILAKLEWFLPHFKKLRRELKMAFFLVNVIINNCFALTIIVNLTELSQASLPSLQTIKPIYHGMQQILGTD